MTLFPAVKTLFYFNSNTVYSVAMFLNIIGLKRKFNNEDEIEQSVACVGCRPCQ